MSVCLQALFIYLFIYFIQLFDSSFSRQHILPLEDEFRVPHILSMDMGGSQRLGKAVYKVN